MTTDEFASKIKAKYPSYANMDNKELTSKIVAKYPQYKSQITDNQKPMPMGQKAYNFAQESVPYVAGGATGLLTSELGPEASIPAAGLAYAGAKSGLRGVGKMLGYEKPNTLGQEVKQTALKDVPTGIAMEETAPVLKGVLNSSLAKKTGQGLADMFSTLPGVESRNVQTLFKNPKAILPEWMGGPAALKETGEKIGAMESKLGIPGIEEREGAQVLRAKPATGMKPGEVKIKDPSRDPKAYMENIQRVLKSVSSRKASFEEALDALKAEVGSGVKENDRQIASKVYDELKTGKMPELPETVQAIKGVDNRLETMSENPTTEESQNKLLLTRYRKKLVQHLSDMVPELQKLRSSYAMGKVREEFTSPSFGLMAKAGKGQDIVSRMGANRLVGPFALMRMATNPAFGALLGASQSPLVLGGATAGAGALAQGLQSRLTPYAIKSLLETMRRKKQASEPTQ